MKRTSIVVSICGMLAISLSNCQPKVDVEAEKEAILAVVLAESESARDGDVEKLKSLYIQDTLNTRLILNPDTFTIRTGWDELGPLFDQYAEREGLDLSAIRISKENPVIKVMGNTAWLICDNNWHGEYQGEPVHYESIQVTFLEKVDGDWKFSCAAWYVKPGPGEDGENDDTGDGDEGSDRDED